MGEMISFQNEGKEFPVYLSKPTNGDVKGGLIVIHEVWGLVPHIKDVADRYAREGYLVLAPDLLSETGITEQLFGDLQEELFDPARKNQAQPKIRQLTAPLYAPGFAETAIAKLHTCFDYLMNQAETNSRVAVTGFCFGGSYSFTLAVEEPRLKAAAAFYGHADYSVEELKRIKCPVMAFYGEQDERLMAGLSELKKKMQEAGVNFTAQVYPNCGHAFFNNTNRFAYNEAAAKDAWPRVLSFLAANMQ